MWGRRRKKSKDTEQIMAELIRQRKRRNSRAGYPPGGIMSAAQLRLMRNENLRRRGIDPNDHAAIQALFDAMKTSSRSPETFNREISDSQYIIDEEPELT